jgi:hypothetical protein
MTDWKNISDKNSAFTTFTQTVSVEAEKKGKKVLEFYSLLLEERNKSWGYPYNWRLSVFEESSETRLSLWENNFYTNVSVNISDIKKTALDIFHNLIK